MIKVRELLGMTVYTPNKQKVLGHVCDISVWPDGSISGIVVERGGFISRQSFIMRKDLLSISKNGIIANPQSGGQRNNIPQHQLLGHNKIIGSRINSGGRISDLLVENDRIVSVEVSNGLLHDWRYGRSLIGWELFIR